MYPKVMEFPNSATKIIATSKKNSSYTGFIVEAGDGGHSIGDWSEGWSDSFQEMKLENISDKLIETIRNYDDTYLEKLGLDDGIITYENINGLIIIKEKTVFELKEVLSITSNSGNVKVIFYNSSTIEFIMRKDYDLLIADYVESKQKRNYTVKN